jgi:hypothetical protein
MKEEIIGFVQQNSSKETRLAANFSANKTYSLEFL